MSALMLQVGAVCWDISEMFVECVEGPDADSIVMNSLADSYPSPCCSESFRRRPGCMKPGSIAEMLGGIATVRVFYV